MLESKDQWSFGFDVHLRVLGGRVANVKSAPRGLFGRERLPLERQAEPFPDLQQGLGERIDQAVVMIRRGRDAQPLGPLGDRWVIDRLDIDAVLLEEEVGGALALLGITNKQRN